MDNRIQILFYEDVYIKTKLFGKQFNWVQLPKFITNIIWYFVRLERNNFLDNCAYKVAKKIKRKEKTDFEKLINNYSHITFTTKTSHLICFYSKKYENCNIELDVNKNELNVYDKDNSWLGFSSPTKITGLKNLKRILEELQIEKYEKISNKNRQLILDDLYENKT